MNKIFIRAEFQYSRIIFGLQTFLKIPSKPGVTFVSELASLKQEVFKLFDIQIYKIDRSRSAHLHFLLCLESLAVFYETRHPYIFSFSTISLYKLRL